MEEVLSEFPNLCRVELVEEHINFGSWVDIDEDVHDVHEVLVSFLDPLMILNVNDKYHSLGDVEDLRFTEVSLTVGLLTSEIPNRNIHIEE